MSTFRALRATSAAACREALANRAGFATHVVIMILNDVAWVAFWGLFFNGVGEVRGWELDDVLLLFATLTTTAGIVMGFLGNARRIGPQAVEGGLDASLSLPVPTLPHLLLRRVIPLHVGDMIFGIGLFLASGHLSIGRVATYLLGTVAGVSLLTGFLVALGSLSLFTGRSEVGDFGFEATILLAFYPVDIFTGSIKFLLYTVVPSAFIASVPARLISDFELTTALVLVGAAAVFATGGALVFHAGLRRYTSGSVWTRA